MALNNNEKRPDKNYQAPKGKLNNLAGGLFFGGGENGALTQPDEFSTEGAEIPLSNGGMQVEQFNPINYPSAPQPTDRGFFKELGYNLLTKGQYGLNKLQAEDQAKINEYNHLMQRALLQQRLQGGQQLEGIRHQNSISEAERENQLRAQLASQQNIDNIKQLRLKAALENKLSTPEQFDSSLAPLTIAKNTGELQNQNVLNAAYQTPDLQTALVKAEFDKLGKVGFDNASTAANTARTIAQTPGEEFRSLGPDAIFNPTTREIISNVRPFEQDPAKDYLKGGVSSGVIPQGSLGGQFVKRPGGVNAEGVGNITASGAQMVAPTFQLNTQAPSALTPFPSSNQLAPQGTLEELVKRFRLTR